MFSRLFNRGKKEDPAYNLPVPEDADWSFLGTDMHSHFLPGIDDGAKTIEDSITMLRRMMDMGYKNIITTPHIMIDYHPNTTQTIQAALERVEIALKEHNIHLPIKAAAEYYIDEHFMHLLATEPLLTVNKNEVLVEFSMMYEPPMLNQAFFEMQKAGYRPILAHPERYMSMHKNIERYADMKDRGCLLQLNMLSIAGYYGPGIKNVAGQLLSQGLYDYCGSDAHHEKHISVLKAMTRTKDYNKFAGYRFLNTALEVGTA